MILSLEYEQLRKGGCLLVAKHPSNMLVHLKDGSPWTSVRSATLRQKLQIKLSVSRYTDTGPTDPSADPITPDAWQGSHWSTSFEVTGVTRPGKRSTAQAGI